MAPQWVGIDPSTGYPRRVQERSAAVAAVWPIDRQVGKALAIVPYRDEVLVDGLSAPPLAVLTSRSSLVLAPGVHSYLTERIRPHIGPPTAEMIAARCPYCKIPIEEKDYVVSHRCGVVYHHRAPEPNGATDDPQPQSCFEQVRFCLSCSRPMTLEEELVWDPADLATAER